MKQEKERLTPEEGAERILDYARKSLGRAAPPLLPALLSGVTPPRAAMVALPAVWITLLLQSAVGTADHHGFFLRAQHHNALNERLPADHRSERGAGALLFV